MQHPDIVYKGEFTVGTYDIDSDKHLTVPALTRMMHESAMQNVLKLKISVWDLAPHGVSWVLMRKRTDIKRHLRLGEKFTVETHPSGFDKLLTYRDFKVFDEQGEMVASASSTWLLMDLVRRRMTRIPAFIKEIEMPEVEFLPRPGKLVVSQETDDIETDDVDFPTDDYTQTFKVGWFDLDWNEHLNNTQYSLRMINTLPFEVCKHQSLERMDISFKMECRYGEEIICTAKQVGGNTYFHRMIHQESGKEVATAKTIWKPE